MKIPVSALKDFAKKYDLTHTLLYAYDSKTNNQHIVTYGCDAEKCIKLAEFANEIQKLLGWPESLRVESASFKKLKKQLTEAKKEINRLKNALLLLKE